MTVANLAPTSFHGRWHWFKSEPNETTLKQLYLSEKSIISNTNMKLPHNELIASPSDNAFWFGRVRSVLSIGGTIILMPKLINPLLVLSKIKSKDFSVINMVDGYVNAIKFVLNEK